MENYGQVWDSQQTELRDNGITEEAKQWHLQQLKKIAAAEEKAKAEAAAKEAAAKKAAARRLLPWKKKDLTDEVMKRVALYGTQEMVSNTITIFNDSGGWDDFVKNAVGRLGVINPYSIKNELFEQRAGGMRGGGRKKKSSRRKSTRRKSNRRKSIKRKSTRRKKSTKRSSRRMR